MSKLSTVSRLLDLKERKKEELENEVLELRGQIRQLEEGLETLENNFWEMTRDFEEKQQGRDMDLHKLALYYSNFQHLSREIGAQKREIIHRLSELQERETALIEAYKEKKLFEIIKDRIDREMNLNREKAEQKELDFQHLAAMVRGNNNGSGQKRENRK